MLVLSRHAGEEIMIGDNIIITVASIRGDKCRIAVTAPREIPVHRHEVAEAIARKKARDAGREGEGKP